MQIGYDLVDDAPKYICLHHRDTDEDKFGRFQYFIGRGIDYAIICDGCFYNRSSRDRSLVQVSDRLFEIYDLGNPLLWEGVIGEPEVLIGDEVDLQQQKITVINTGNESVELDWSRYEVITSTLDVITSQPILLLKDRLFDRLEFTKYLIVKINQQASSIDLIYEINDANIELFHRIKLIDKISMQICHKAGIAVLANQFGQYGVVLDIKSHQVLLDLDRGGYHSDESSFPFQLVEIDNSWVIIHGTDWNRLDITNLQTGKCMTTRSLSESFNYFHGQLSLSPDKNWILDDGWVWGPLGMLKFWNLKEWLQKPQLLESDQIQQTVCSRDDWGFPLCWVDDTIFITLGYGSLGGLYNGLTMYDISNMSVVGWFPGPAGYLNISTNREFVIDYHGSARSEYRNHLRIWQLTTGRRVYNRKYDQVITSWEDYILVVDDGKLKILNLT